MPEWVDDQVVNGADMQGGRGRYDEQGCNWDPEVSTCGD